MAKSIKTQLNEANKTIEKLTNDIKNIERNKDHLYNQWQNLKAEIDSVHAALDTLPGLPAKRYKVDEYSTVDLTLNARLFAWIANIAFYNNKKGNINE